MHACRAVEIRTELAPKDNGTGFRIGQVQTLHLWQIAPGRIPVQVHWQAIAAPAIYQRAIVPIFPKVHDFSEHDHMIGGIDDLPLATTERGGCARKYGVSELILGILDPEPLLLAG